MYSKKISGPKTEPCGTGTSGGTPDMPGTSGEHSPSSTTALVRPLGKSLPSLALYL